MRPSKGVFDVALLLVWQPACRLFGKGQMSLLLLRCNTNVAVVLNLCHVVRSFYNLPRLVPVSKDQPHISLRITLRFRPSYSCFIVDRWPSFRTSPQSRT